MTKTITHILTFVMRGGLFSSCSSSKGPLPVVPKVDLQRYIGRWYEIAKLPNSFEKNLTCITAT